MVEAPNGEASAEPIYEGRPPPELLSGYGDTVLPRSHPNLRLILTLTLAMTPTVLSRSPQPFMLATLTLLSPHTYFTLAAFSVPHPLLTPTPSPPHRSAQAAPPEGHPSTRRS